MFRWLAWLLIRWTEPKKPDEVKVKGARASSTFTLGTEAATLQPAWRDPVYNSKWAICELMHVRLRAAEFLVSHFDRPPTNPVTTCHKERSAEQQQAYAAALKFLNWLSAYPNDAQ